jgi:hypothetical protein
MSDEATVKSSSANVICPECGAQIPLADVNVATDIAVCRRCEKNFPYSELSSRTPEEVDLRNPPKGVWYRQDFRGCELGATTRSWGALFLVPFTAVWSGGSMGGIYGTQIYQWKFEPLLSLFGIPFLLGSILLVSLCAMSVCGKVVVTIADGRVKIFTGALGIGLRRSFPLGSFSGVEDGRPKYSYSGQGSVGITLVGERKYSFGTMLSEERQHFILNALRKVLLAEKKAVGQGV